MANSNSISFEIVEQIGVLKEQASGWKRELNLVSWNGQAPKYDIREWSEGHEHMSRGITLTEKEMNMVVQMVTDRRGE